MTRRDLRTFAWLAPLAIWLSVWWVLRGSPCLDNALRERWNQWFPAPASRQSDHDAYGIVACDYWPETRDHVITIVTIILVTWLIGHLAARHFEHQPARRGGTIMFAALTFAMGLSNLAFLPGLVRDTEFIGNEPAMLQIGLSLLTILVGTLLATLAAWVTLRTRTRG